MKVYRRKISKAARESMRRNAAVGADGYMLAPPDRLDIKFMGLTIASKAQYSDKPL